MRNFFFLLFASFSVFAEQTTVLFHLHDAGETFALLPVIREMDKEEYLIIASGIAAGLLGEIPKERLRTFDQMEEIEPQKVLTGVASELQGETLDFFREQGVETLAFWDNFNSKGPSDYFPRAHSIQERADVLLLPSDSLISSFSYRKTRVVGHPTLVEKEKPKLIVWVGGYGSQYEEAYALFKEGMKSIEGCIVLNQHHPKTGRKNDLKTVEAIAIADVVVCHQSTVAFQALSKNKPVLHIIPKGQTYDTLPIQKGLAKKVTTLEEFPAMLTETLNSDVLDFYEVMGIPKDSIARIISFL